MPKPFLYGKGERLRLNVRVADDTDAGNPVIDIGGELVSITREALDRADARTEGRPLTDEEADRKRLAEEAEAERVAKAEREAPARKGKKQEAP